MKIWLKYTGKPGEGLNTIIRGLEVFAEENKGSLFTINSNPSENALYIEASSQYEKELTALGVSKVDISNGGKVQMRTFIRHWEAK